MTSPAGQEIERLIQLLAKLPGLGPRSARRAALVLLKKRESLLEPLAAAMAAAASAIKTCSCCGNLDTRDPCTICTDARRDNSVMCVVEDVAGQKDLFPGLGGEGPLDTGIVARRHERIDQHDQQGPDRPDQQQRQRDCTSFEGSPLHAASVYRPCRDSLGGSGGRVQTGRGSIKRSYSSESLASDAGPDVELCSPGGV